MITVEPVSEKRLPPSYHDGDGHEICQKRCARSSVNTPPSASHGRTGRSHIAPQVTSLSLPPTATVGGVYIDDLVILTILHFRNVRLRTSPLEVQRAYSFSMIISRCLHTQVRQVPQSRESFGEDASVASQAPGGFALERRLSLMLTKVFIAAVGVNRTLLQPLLGGWAFALASRREVFASLDVSYVAAASPPLRTLRQVKGALLDVLWL